jgi:hypothetical protein
LGCPAGIPAHNAEQIFYFDEAFMLRQFDFQAVGPSARGPLHQNNRAGNM